MFRIEKKKVALLIGLGVVLLLICFGVVFVIDRYFALDPWGDGDVESLWYFLVGSIFFPGALRRYRAGRKGERTIPWYQRIDLILCLIGLVFGLMFALSIVQKWVWSVLMNNTAPPMVNESSLNILAVAVTSVDLCWIALIGVLFFQMVKQIKQRRTDPPQTT